MSILIELQPTKTKIQLDTNQIKRRHFEAISEYIPDIFDEAEERGVIEWLKVPDGYIWFERPVKKRPPNVFVPKNNASKTSIFADGHRKI